MGALLLLLPHRADFCTICATSTAVGWRCPACCPQSQTGSHTRTNSPVTMPASPPPPPRVSFTTTWLLSTTSPSGPPTLPLLLPDPGSLLQNLHGWLHHGLELPCLPQWGPCLSHPPASVPPTSSFYFRPLPHPPPTNMFTCSGFISTSPFTPSPP